MKKLVITIGETSGIAMTQEGQEMAQIEVLGILEFCKAMVTSGLLKDVDVLQVPNQTSNTSKKTVN